MRLRFSKSAFRRPRRWERLNKQNVIVFEVEKKLLYVCDTTCSQRWSRLSPCQGRPFRRHTWEIRSAPLLGLCWRHLHRCFHPFSSWCRPRLRLARTQLAPSTLPWKRLKMADREALEEPKMWLRFRRPVVVADSVWRASTMAS